jgi:hypothetical protein
MKKFNYEKYFAAGQQAKIVVKLGKERFLDRNAEITSVDREHVVLEILGDGLPEKEMAKEAGARVAFSAASGWGLFRCNAFIERVITSKELYIRLDGDVIEQQRREYFRLDVDVPLLYTVPEDQHSVSVTATWNEKRMKYLSREPVMSPYGNGYKVIKWLGGDDLLPQSINLSGGGLRIKTKEYIGPVTMVLVDIFLPLAPTRIIAAVAEAVRCKEIQLNWEKGTSFNTAFKFVKIDEKDRETIITYVFGEQRNQLQAMRQSKQ